MVKKLINTILQTKPKLDAPSGESPIYECPFCESIKVGGSKTSFTMEQLPHKENCIYIMAKELKEKEL